MSGGIGELAARVLIRSLAIVSRAGFPPGISSAIVVAVSPRTGPETGIRAGDGIKLLAGRIVSLHLKERAALGPGHHDEIFGTGITDIPAILAELRRQKFDGNIAIEYEYNWQNSVPDIAQCVGFVRGWTVANPQ